MTFVVCDPLPGSFAALQREREAEGLGCDALAAHPAPGFLPCLNSNNSIDNILTGGQRRTAFSLSENVKLMAEDHGLEHLLFNTLTFRDHVTDIKEAQRRFNSLRSNVLSKRYSDFVTVVERQKSGRIHFHILAAVADDVRTGFDFAAVSQGDYRSACAALRSEWAFWRKTAKEYGFGRTEQMPVKSTSEGIAKYVGKYIAKHLDQRRDDDKGARLVRYSESARRCGTRFAWTGAKSKLWRKKLAQFAYSHGCVDFKDLQITFGKNWAYKYAEYIVAEVIA